MLEVVVADRIEPLLNELVEHLREPAGDPFAPEWVAVPSIGMRRWLAQRLSEGLGTSGPGQDGVSANIELPFPAELRRVVLAADAAARGVAAAEDPWAVERLTWRVLEVLTDPGDAAAALGPLSRRVEGVALTGRALALGDLLDRYVVHRPGMLRQWVDGDDVDGGGDPLEPAQQWQPVLFRRVRDLIGVPSPAEQLDAVLHRVRTGELDPVLPERTFLFGLSTLPPDLLPLVEAIAARREMRALLLSPSAERSRMTAAVLAGAGPSRGAVLRRDVDHAEDVRHPLLRSWGTASRESACLLGSSGLDVRFQGAVPSAGPGDASLLARLQADIRNDRAPDGTHDLVPGDASVQVHACTGVTRQVEVLRDSLLHLFADRPDLTEADVAVLCPRIEQFAPIISAVFGPSADEGGDVGPRGPRLRYRITDRSIRSDVPVLGVAAALVDLLPGRFNASAVADFLGLPPVRARFGLAAEDLGRLDEWIEASNVRWGLDGAHRAEWHLPADFPVNTWASGIDQLLVGTAIRGDGATLAVGGVAPLPVGESATVTAARVAEALRTLAEVRRMAQGSRTIDDWCVLVARAVDLTCSLPPTEGWQRRRLDRVLADLRDLATLPDGTPSSVGLSLADLRRLLTDQLTGDPARAAFGTGTVTICSLSPLRSVPHQVVCILGLDQDALPRGLASGDDLLASAPAVGDRDPRTEARQLLLEAVLAAGRSLVITYGAADVRTNAAVPPAVVLDELWDCLSDTCRQDDAAVRAAVEVHHPRQAFDASNFHPGSSLGERVGGPWSFDPLGRDGAAAVLDRPERSVPRPLVDHPLPLDPGGEDAVVALSDLHLFVRTPVEQFFRRTLGVRLPDIPDEPTDELPVELGNLERYQVGDALLHCAIRNEPDDDVAAVLRASGALPPGRLGTDLLADLRVEVLEYVKVAGTLGVPLDADDVHQVDVTVAGDRRVRGSVACSSTDDPGPLRVRFSRPKSHHELLLALDLCALTVSEPGTDWRAVSIHRGESKGKRPTVHVLRVRGDDAPARVEVARRALSVVVDLRHDGLARPLPLFDRTSAYLAVSDFTAARTAWGDETKGDCADGYHRLAFGPLTFNELMASGRHAGSAGDAVAVARRLWDGVHGAVRADPAGESS